tara:strand:+ start:372 stop:554 length:183 start_codon:yes stop_codon:yes gene_type:complete
MTIQNVKRIHDDRLDVINEGYLMLYYNGGQQFCVPVDTANRHYKEILVWVADGNSIADAD